MKQEKGRTEIVLGHLCGFPWECEAVIGLSKSKHGRKLLGRVLLRTLHENDED